MTNVHSFDTGLSVPQRTLLQQGAIDLLSKLTRAQGGYLASVIPFGGLVRTYTDEVDIELLMRQFGKTPAIGIGTGTRPFQTLNVSRREFKSDVQLLVYFATQHGRDMQRGRMEADVRGLTNAQADPGLHVIMEHTLELLCGVFPTTLTSTIKQIIPEREEELAPLPEITIWLQTYNVQLSTLKIADRGGSEWRTPEQLLESIGWRITTDPHEVDAPAPATSSTTLDAEDP